LQDNDILINTKLFKFEQRRASKLKRLLIVDDEEKIRAVIREYAEFSGYEAEEAADGMSAIGMVKLNDYDLIIMDIMMPKLDGFSAIKEIQKIKKIPVIMLSARGEEYDKLFGFELGIDDYVVKPFSPKELMARVNAVLKRYEGGEQANSNIAKFEGLEVNFAARTVSVDGNRINLTPKEYDLLFYLIQNKNIALSRDKLLSDIWGYDFFGDDRTIDTHVKNLRNNLGPYRKFIVTLRGVGYKFEYDGE
jgi:two-component system, OmpR family, response regulator ResD